MRQSVRWLLAAALSAASAFLLPAIGSSATSWNIGDVFVGVGREGVRAGQYLVYSEDGTPKDAAGLVDPNARRTGTTVGCAIDPTQVDGALFATTFFNRNLTRFAPDAPHATTLTAVPSSVTVAGVTYTVEATESVVFDTAGNYYVGALTPGRESAADPLPLYGFIFKFNASHQQVATYAVPVRPNGARGADWIDLATDNRTLYYTSEGATIHSIKPDVIADNPASPNLQVFSQTGDPRYAEIPVHEVGASVPIGGILYAIRLLPPMPGDTTLQPSGFLIAHSSGPIRVAADGTVLTRYDAQFPSSVGPGLFFALNVTPDGQSFWTATFQEDPEDTQAPFAGRLVRVHIPSGAVTTVVTTGAPNVWGLCVKREYTAAVNICHEKDASGVYQPVVCRVPEVCNDGLDNDGDGRADTYGADVDRDGDIDLPADLDCAAPGAPVFTVLPEALAREDWDGDFVSFSLAPHVFDSNTPSSGLTFTQVGNALPPGVTLSPAGLISGTIAHGTALLFGPGGRSITVEVSDGTSTGRITFLWKVNHRNGPPALTNPGALVFTVDRTTAVPLIATDPDRDLLQVQSSGLPAWLTLSDIGPAPGYSLTLTANQPPLLVADVPVTIRIRECASNAPACGDWIEQSFTVSVRNLAPVITLPPAQQSIVGQAIAPVVIPVADPDHHEPLVYSPAISGLPAGLSAAVTPAGLLITGTPTAVTPSGGHTVTIAVMDTTVDPASRRTTVATFVWTVIDNRPPACPAAAPTQAMWPPNHKFVQVGITGITDPDGDTVSITITDIWQDEPVNVKGDGNTGADGRIDGATAWLRAERTGVKAVPGDGRIYEIRYTATDGKPGGTCSGSVFVGVPHDQGQRRLPIDSLKRWNSITGAIVY